MRKWPLLACLILGIPGVAHAQEDAASDYSEIEKLFKSFRDATVYGDVVTTAYPDVVSPFGGPSQLPSETTDPVTITGTFTGLFNSGSMPIPLPDGVEPGGYLRPPPGGEITSLYDIDALRAAFGLDRLPPLAEDAMTRQDIVDAVSGSDHVLVGEGDPFGGPVVIHGGVVAQPIPLDCPGQTLEYGRVDLIGGQPAWQGFAENDLFNGGSQAIVTRCVEGQWEVERLVNQGDQFVAGPTETLTLVFAQGWYSFTPVEEVQGSMGNRYFGFVTETSDPFQPDTTGSTAVPFPELAPIEPYVLLTDPNAYLPGRPFANHPLFLEFSNGTCPPADWADGWEFYVVDDPATQLYMEQLSTGQLVTGGATANEDGSYTYNLDGSGDGFTERYQWSEPIGTYTLGNGTDCTWDLQMDPAVWDSINEDVTAMIAQEETTTTAAPSTTAGQVTTSTQAGTPTEEPSAEEGVSWPWALIAIGVVALALGGFFLFGAKNPCDDLRKTWEAAERRRKSAQDGLDQAENYLKERKARVTEVEADLAGYEAAGQSSITENGVTYHAIEGGRVTSEGLDSLTDGARRTLADAQAARADAESSVAEWEHRVGETAKAADQARAEYEECVGQHTPKKNSVEAGSVAVGPEVVTAPATEQPDCQPGDKEVRPAGTPDTINVDVDFSIFVEVTEESERNVEEGQALALNLAQLAKEIGALDQLLGGYGAGRTIAQGIGLQAGKYTLSGGDLVQGGVDAFIAGYDPSLSPKFDIWVPTSPQDVVTETLKATAQLGSIISGKVSEWMEGNQLYRVRVTYFYQTITAVPYQVWICQGGRWVCRETIFEITVSGLQRRAGQVKADIDKKTMERELGNLTSVARNAIRQSVQRKAEFEQAHQPGPCR